MLDVAFVTHRASPLVVNDDQLVADALRHRGIAVVPAVWDDADTDWARFACVVIRSPWDYHLRADEYRAWLRALASAHVNLWNPAEAVLANIDKRYLLDLAERGVPVVPTVYLPCGVSCRLVHLLETRKWNEVVIKPAVSASAHGTWRSSLATALEDQRALDSQIRTANLLVQPYLEEVAQEGEWSIVFFAGRYSHSALKRPAQGGYKVQSELGGSAEPAEPSSALVEQAAAVLTNVDARLLYARVDGVDRAGQFTLMELEINEPYLFVATAPGAPERFADAIAQCCNRAGQ